MTIDVSLAVDALSSDDVVRQRGAAGSYVDGTWTPGAVTSATIRASVTPLPAREVERLADGQRTRGGIRVITTATDGLRVAQRETGVPCDRLVYRGRVYEVSAVDDWTSYGGWVDARALEVEP